MRNESIISFIEKKKQQFLTVFLFFFFFWVVYYLTGLFVVDKNIIMV